MALAIGCDRKQVAQEQYMDCVNAAANRHVRLHRFTHKSGPYKVRMMDGSNLNRYSLRLLQPAKCHKHAAALTMQYGLAH